MTTYTDTDDFQGATFYDLSMRDARIRQADVRGMTMRGVFLDGLDIDSHDLAMGTLVVNGVDVVPFVEAELDRRFPGRGLRHAQTPGDLRGAWDAARGAWAEVVASTPPELVDAHVPDEWSFAQTLRHLVLATDTWLGKAIRGEEQPFHEIGQIFDGAAEMGFDCSIFRDGPVPYAEVLEVRAERQQRVSDFLAEVTPEQLAEERADPWGGPGGGWSPTVGDCVRVILDEEWAHLRYATRDLAVLGGARG